VEKEQEREKKLAHIREKQDRFTTSYSDLEARKASKTLNTKGSQPVGVSSQTLSNYLWKVDQ
jgi:RecG-like helicase